MAIQTKNNFDTFKSDFKKDTGLEVSGNMGLYISYFNARVNDYSMQMNIHAGNEVLNRIQHLPENLRPHLADMIKSLKKEGVI